MPRAGQVRAPVQERLSDRIAIGVLTAILDPAEAPAAALAALYHQRWELEAALDELEVRQRGAGVVLRSRSPELVAQEVWGCCWSTVRSGC